MIRATALAWHPAGVFDDGGANSGWGLRLIRAGSTSNSQEQRTRAPRGPLQHYCLDRLIHSQSDGEGEKRWGEKIKKEKKEKRQGAGLGLEVEEGRRE